MTMETLHPSRPVAHGRVPRKVEYEVIIARPPEDVYAFWRDFRNLPKFMEDVTDAEWTEDRQVARWHAEGSFGMRRTSEVAIINDHPGRLISWETLDGSTLAHAGTVRFDPAENPDWTRVRLVLDYYPLEGLSGFAEAIMMSDPETLLKRDLMNLKTLLEAHHDAVI
jgi:uncharacterized membrane protein